MKKIYEIPEVTIFEVGPAKGMLANSDQFGVGLHSAEEGTVNTGENFGNSNYMDDQSTPWYRR